MSKKQCERCNGSGEVKHGNGWAVCSACLGQGSIYVDLDTTHDHDDTCPTCKGVGRIESKASSCDSFGQTHPICPRCGGSGKRASWDR